MEPMEAVDKIEDSHALTSVHHKRLILNVDAVALFGCVRPRRRRCILSRRLGVANEDIPKTWFENPHTRQSASVEELTVGTFDHTFSYVVYILTSLLVVVIYNQPPEFDRGSAKDMKQTMTCNSNTSLQPFELTIILHSSLPPEIYPVGSFGCCCGTYRESKRTRSCHYVKP
jgi:hypothetical protein